MTLEVRENRFIFPPSAANRLLDYGETTVTLKDHLPAVRSMLGRVPTPVMNAMTISGEREDIKAVVYNVWTLHGVVERSPLLHLLNWDSRQRKPLPRYDTSLNVLWDLRYLYKYCLHAPIPHKDGEGKSFDSYQEQVDQTEEHLFDVLLPPIFASGQEEPFCQVMYEKTLHEIHLLERCIFTCLFEGEIPMACVLTPQTAPLPFALLDKKNQATFLEQVGIAFMTMEAQFNNLCLEKEEDEEKHWFALGCPRGGTVWQGFLPLEWIQQFMRFMYDMAT